MNMTSDFPKLLLKDMYKWFMEEYETFKPVYPQLFEVVESDTGYEQETTGIGLGLLSERKENDPIIYDKAMEGYTSYAKMREFSSAFSITNITQADTPANKVRDTAATEARSWAQAVIATEESFAAKFFNFGGYTAGHDVFNNSTKLLTDPTGDLAYDGKPFFNLSGNNRSAKGHATTYYNGIGSALDGTTIQTLYTLMTATNNRNERGEIVNIMPDTLVIPPALKFTARSILESSALITGENATKGDANTNQNLLTPIEWQYLSDTDAWFIGKKQKGLKFYKRQVPTIRFWIDESTRALHYSISTRFGAGMHNWRYWGGSNFATSA